MTLQQLKYVVEVAERGSITEAAKSLFIAQPSLSAAIRDLEEETGTTIFLRNSRGGLPGHSVGIRHICHRLHGPFKFRQCRKHCAFCRFKAAGQLACQPCGQPLLLLFGHFVLHRPQTVLRLEQLVQ